MDSYIYYSYLYSRKGLIMKEVRIKDEFIKLGQALKLAGLVESGVVPSLLYRMVRFW